MGDMSGDFVDLAISENKRRLKELYALLLERVKVRTVAPKTISEADLLEIAGTEKELSALRVTALISKVDTLGLPTDAIKIVFVSKSVGYGVSLGLNLHYLNSRSDIVLCFLKTLAKDQVAAIKYGTTLAHECGHSLRGVDHRELGGIYDLSISNPSPALPAWLLMAGGAPQNNFIYDDAAISGKRWYLRDQGIVNSATGNIFSQELP
jgi:hypothetical protein